jgi:hypothetical protein
MFPRKRERIINEKEKISEKGIKVKNKTNIFYFDDMQL